MTLLNAGSRKIKPFIYFFISWNLDCSIFHLHFMTNKNQNKKIRRILFFLMGSNNKVNITIFHNSNFKFGRLFTLILINKKIKIKLICLIIQETFSRQWEFNIFFFWMPSHKLFYYFENIEEQLQGG